MQSEKTSSVSSAAKEVANLLEGLGNKELALGVLAKAVNDFLEATESSQQADLFEQEGER